MRDTQRRLCSDSQVSWTCDVLPGLPGTGPRPEQFSAFGGTHREGLVVRFTSSEGESWVGNFQPLHRTYASGVFAHPAGDSFVVLASGKGYVVEPATRRLREVIGPAICACAQDEGRLALGTDTAIIVLERHSRWVTERLAWDGVADLRIQGDRLVGRGRDALVGDWSPIELDLRSHAVLRSAYDVQVVRPAQGWRSRLRAALSRLLHRR